MLLKGDLGKSFPADLLMFLSQMGKEGLLTVQSLQKTLTISFKDGYLVDAHSLAGDAKIIKILVYQKQINKDKLIKINQLRKDTKIPLKNIITELSWFSDTQIKPIFQIGVQEVLFEFFLMKSGKYHFADIVIKPEHVIEFIDIKKMVFFMTHLADEWENIIRQLASLERILHPTPEAKNMNGLSSEDKFIYQLCNGKRSIQNIIEMAPVPSVNALKTINNGLSKNYISLGPLTQPEKEKDTKKTLNQLIYDAKQSIRKLLLASNTKEKIETIIAFCVDHFHHTMMMVIHASIATELIIHHKNENGLLDTQKIKNTNIDIRLDPVLKRVYQSLIPFLGKLMEKDILEPIVKFSLDQDCILIPIVLADQSVNILFVMSPLNQDLETSFHLLEIIAWQITPPKNLAIQQPEKSQVQSSATQPSNKKSMTEIKSQIISLVKAIEELPPMPHVVTQVFDLLSQPDSSMNDFSKIISQDQALVIKILKISNSVLYSTGQEVKNLNDALTRIGTTTIRSIVLASSTKSLFPTDHGKIGRWSKHLWQHSKECAVVAKRIARFIAYEDPEEAFVGGMLHDIGKLILLLERPDDYQKIQDIIANDGKTSTVAETAALGFDHAVVGELLMRKWKMPEGIRSCIRYHHKHKAPKTAFTLVSIVALGDLLSQMHGTKHAENIVMDKDEITRLYDFLNIAAAQQDDLKEHIIEDLKHIDVLDA